MRGNRNAALGARVARPSRSSPLLVPPSTTVFVRGAELRLVERNEKKISHKIPTPQKEGAEPPEKGCFGSYKEVREG
jgi:hypothetical protein